MHKTIRRFDHQFLKGSGEPEEHHEWLREDGKWDLMQTEENNKMKTRFFELQKVVQDVRS